MIEHLSNKCAIWVRTHDSSTAFSYDMLYYSFRVTINFIAVWLFCAIIGFATGKFAETAMALTSFVILRMFSGGFHFKSLDLCTIVTVCLLVPVPHVAIGVNEQGSIICTSLALLLVIAKAPTNLKNTKWTDKAKPWFKIISILLVSTNFLIMSPVIALSLLLQSLLLIPERRCTI